MASETVKTIGLVAAILAAFATFIVFLMRQGFKHLLAKDIERFKSDLRLIAIEHEVRFSKLHEQRMEIIAELYGFLSRIEQEFVRVIDALKSQDDTSKEPAFSKLNELGKDFRDFYIPNRIFLDEETCNKLNAFSSEIGRSFLEFLNTSKGMGKKSRQEWNQLLSEILKKHNEDLQVINHDIEKTFRALLGVGGHS